MSVSNGKQISGRQERRKEGRKGVREEERERERERWEGERSEKVSTWALTWMDHLHFCHCEDNRVSVSLL